MEDVILTWKGEDYIIEARNVLMLIAKVEEHLTAFELYQASEKQTVPMAKAAMAYGAALRHAGARVSNEEVYEAMFEVGETNSIIQVINALLAMMVPPAKLQEKGDGKKKAGRAAKGNSLKKPTKPPSRGDSRPESSGE